MDDKCKEGPSMIMREKRQKWEKETDLITERITFFPMYKPLVEKTSHFTYIYQSKSIPTDKLGTHLVN